jgi:hypothetical protein
MKTPSRVPRRLGTVVVLCTLFLMVFAGSAFALSTSADDTATTNGTVYATAQYGGIMFIGGTFTHVSAPVSGGTSIAAENLAAVDMTTGKPIITFSPAVTGNAQQEAQVQSLAVVGNTLYVGGQFAAVDGHAHYNLAAIDIDPGTFAGTVDNTFNATVGVPGAAGEGSFFAYDILPGASGVYVGGVFGKVDGTTRNNIAEVGWDGSLVSSWNLSGVNSAVRDMQPAPNGNSIFVAGGFSAPRQSILRASAATGALDPWAIPAGGIVVGNSSDPGMTCWSLAVSASRLFAGCGRQPNYAAAFRLDNGNSGDRTWLMNFVGNVQSVGLTPAGTGLIVGGHFGTFLKQKVCGGKLMKNLGILKNIFTAKAKVNCNFRPNFEGQNPFGGVWDIQTTSQYLWVAGGFETVGGIAHRGIARFTW